MLTRGLSPCEHEGEGLGVRLKKREQLLPFSIILSLVEIDYSLI